jgi:uncharacterized protein YjbJ (UPF0337 family)
MNWNRIESNWKEFKGHVRSRWDQFTDHELDAIAGKRDLVLGRIQELYGQSKKETDAQLTDWEKSVLENAQPGDTTIAPPAKPK